MNSLVSYSGSSSEDEAEEADNMRNTINMAKPAANTKRHAHDSDSDTEMPHQKQRRLDDTSEKQSKRSTENLPLPGAILGMFGDKQVIREDDPQHHGGRVRSFPHVEGNWASYVYVSVSPDERLKSLVNQLLHCLRPLNFERMDDLHISLSKTVCIRHHWIQPLTESLKESFQQLDSCLCDVGALKMYTNDEKTRTFLSLEIKVEETNLMEYVSAVDSCFREFNLPSFYKDPSFHVSLVWCVGDVISQIPEKTNKEIQKLTSEFFSIHTDLSVVPVSQVFFNTGNKTFAFHLHNVDE